MWIRWIRIRNTDRNILNDLKSGVGGDESDHPLDDEAEEQRESSNVEVPLRPDTKTDVSKAKK